MMVLVVGEGRAGSLDKNSSGEGGDVIGFQSISKEVNRIC